MIDDPRYKLVCESPSGKVWITAYETLAEAHAKAELQSKLFKGKISVLDGNDNTVYKSED